MLRKERPSSPNMCRQVWLPFALTLALLASTTRGQAPQDCVSINAALTAANVSLTPAAAQTDCCQFFWASGTNSNADDYYENFVNCAGGRVTRIQFINYNFGSLRYFQNLTALTLLFVRNASIAETIPTWLSTMTNITKLDFNDNGMSGTLEVIGQLPKLTAFSLSNNSFSGSLSWLSNATQLEQIYLDQNQFTGDFPDISNLKSLTNLAVGMNQFTGTLPDLGNFPQLIGVSFYSNGFSGTIPSLSKNTNLVSVNFNNNSLTGPLPDPSNSPKLQYYGIMNNKGITGSIPKGLFTLLNLQTIALSSNSLSGSVDAGLSGMTQLSTLWFDHNPDLNGVLPDLSQLTNLKSLDLSYTGLSGALRLASGVGSTFCDVSSTKLCLVGGSTSSIPSRCQINGGNALAACPAGTSTSSTQTSAGGAASQTATASTGAGQDSSQTGGSNGGSSLGPIIGGVIGGIVALAIVAGLAFFLLRRRDTTPKSGPTSYVPYQRAPTSPPGPQFSPPPPQPFGSPNQFATGQQYGQNQQMANVGSYTSPPVSVSQVSMGSNPSSGFTGINYNSATFGANVPLLAPPGSIGTVNSATSSNSSKVNDVYIVAQPYVANQQDEMTCQQGQKVFVSDLFVDEWCKGLNLETMQTGIVPFAILVPANQPSLVQSRILSGSVFQPHARGQSVGVGSAINIGDQGTYLGFWRRYT
ncbi:L domain-like protein [Gonapodya prolifera JEL478]|uniref:L domain-like protein n=1 Tax=Gonapodya prolifera (strain JEL478) TaxID=1344416 RepID=A0A139AX52_GONPJ|nr:L domain-like protein [Gonapodya prolifera JEL478]|eukprot:KXS21298.1 L domain-like protein [Gonapodya prolifera JEL478]